MKRIPCISVTYVNLVSKLSTVLVKDNSQNLIERLSEELIQQKQGLRENDSTFLSDKSALSYTKIG